MATIPASENVFPEVLLAEVAAPAAAPSGQVRLYVKADGLLYWKDDAGTEYAVGQGDTAGHLADTTDAHDASAISFDPTGLAVITGTEVQTALEELDAASGGGGSLTTVDATLGADVAMATGATFYDGPSNSFAAGTWLIWYKAIFASGTTGQTNDFAVKLWDGTTVYDESSNGVVVNVSSGTIPVEVSGFAVVTLGSTATLKISGTAIRANATMKRDTATGSASSHTATRLTGLKIA